MGTTFYRFTLVPRALALAFVAILCGFSATSAQEVKQNGQESAPRHELKLKGLDGKTYDLAEMRGEVVIVSFGATWCAPCAWEIFALEELKQEYSGKPVRFLWVSIENEKRTSNTILRHYAKSYRVTLPVLRDADMSVFSQFATSVRIPLLVVFDREGRFVAPAHRGMSSEPIVYKQMLRGRIDALLPESAKPAVAQSGAGTR